MNERLAFWRMEDLAWSDREAVGMKQLIDYLVAMSRGSRTIFPCKDYISRAMWLGLIKGVDSGAATSIRFAPDFESTRACYIWNIAAGCHYELVIKVHVPRWLEGFFEIPNTGTTTDMKSLMLVLGMRTIPVKIVHLHIMIKMLTRRKGAPVQFLETTVGPENFRRKRLTIDPPDELASP